jgi:hypothetical protein
MLGEPHRDDTRPKDVFERLAEAEIGGERDRGDDLCEPNPRVDALSLRPRDRGHG